MKINEILKKENIGKRFKFSVNDEIYTVKEVSLAIGVSVVLLLV